MSGSCAVVHPKLHNLPFSVVAILVADTLALALVAIRISSQCGKDKGVAHLDEKSQFRNFVKISKMKSRSNIKRSMSVQITKDVKWSPDCFLRSPRQVEACW